MHCQPILSFGWPLITGLGMKTQSKGAVATAGGTMPNFKTKTGNSHLSNLAPTSFHTAPSFSCGRCKRGLPGGQSPCGVGRMWCGSTSCRPGLDGASPKHCWWWQGTSNTFLCVFVALFRFWQIRIVCGFFCGFPLDFLISAGVFIFGPKFPLRPKIFCYF